MNRYFKRDKYFKRERVDKKSSWYYKDTPVDIIAEIPENATNRDVIKALFPDIERIGGMIGATEYSNEHMSIVADDAWLNKPFKKGDAE